MEFTQKGMYSQMAQRGVSVGTQVRLQDLVWALQPLQRKLGGTQCARFTRGQKVSTSAGIGQRSAEAAQTSLTVLKGRLPTKMPNSRLAHPARNTVAVLT